MFSTPALEEAHTNHAGQSGSMHPSPHLLLSLLKVAGVAVHPYDGQHILGTVVAVQGLLDIPMALTVSPPPGCQLLVVTLLCTRKKSL
eukprot:scaffold287614_cov18-Tisochrysis_lutea.AAC.1